MDKALQPHHATTHHNLRATLLFSATLSIALIGLPSIATQAAESGTITQPEAMS
jgi:hypothetical protein